MANLNNIQLIGRLGKDPESKYTTSGVHVCKFSLAVDAVPPKEHPERKHTEWFNICAWAGLADVCDKYLSKGDLVYVQGEMRTREYEQDGQRRRWSEVNIRYMQMLRTKPKEGGQPPPGTREDSQVPDFDDEIPF